MESLETLSAAVSCGTRADFCVLLCALDQALGALIPVLERLGEFIKASAVRALPGNHQFCHCFDATPRTSDAGLMLVGRMLAFLLHPMLTINPLFGQNAIIQADRAIVVDGTAPARAWVQVAFAGIVATTHAAASGHWAVTFEPQSTGGPHTLVLESEQARITFENIHIGEVWLCAGQSNMEWTVAMLQQTAIEITPSLDIRYFTVQRQAAASPQATAEGAWLRVDGTIAPHVSAVAYFFAQQMAKALRRPVGVVVAALGGTTIPQWMPEETLAKRPIYESLRLVKSPPVFAAYSWLPRSGATTGWESSSVNDEDWEELPVPGYWQRHGKLHNGAVWYRRTVALPRGWVARDLMLEFSCCDDFDETFVNGERVGATGPDDPNAFSTARRYVVPARLTSSGRLVVAVRVFDVWGEGGLCGEVALRPTDGIEAPFILNGIWKARVELALPQRTAELIPAAGLFNAMIHPLTGNRFRGVLWYQGESDTRRAALYRLLLSDFIESWRMAFGDPLLPFGIVQLPGYRKHTTGPEESDWAELRDAQRLAANSQPATGLAVTIDLGEADNVHPPRKQPIGERLARWALATIHGESSEAWSGPQAVDHWRNGPALEVRFVHVGLGLRIRGGNLLAGFQIAGNNRVWEWAEAHLVAADVVRVAAADLAEPVAVRYAWQDNPPCTLENSSGLPASPFRTDDWPLITSTPARSTP